MPYLLGSGGGSAGLDEGARSLIAQLLGIPGETADIAPNAGISADGRQWQNQTSADIPVPDPATEANMLAVGFTDVTQGGGNDSLDTVGPWAGVAGGAFKFGLDPATGDRYYVDTAGDWQPIAAPIDLNTTRVVIAGNAPAPNDIPVSVSGQTRDNGDYEIQSYDDFRVAYQFKTPAAPVEVERESLAIGGVVYVPLTTVADLVPDPNAMVLRTYGLIAETPITAEPDPVDNAGRSGVVYTVPASTSASQKFRGVRHSTAEVFLSGAINGGNGVWINSNTSGDAEFLLTSDGAGGWRASK